MSSYPKTHIDIPMAHDRTLAASPEARAAPQSNFSAHLVHQRADENTKQSAHGEASTTWKSTFCIGICIAVFCSIISLWIVLEVIDADNTTAEAEFSQQAFQAARAFEARLYAYTARQLDVGELIAVSPSIDPLDYVQLLTPLQSQFADQTALSGMSIFEGVSDANLDAFETFLAKDWATDDVPNPPYTFVKRQIVEANGTQRYVPVEKQPFYYVFTRNSDSEIMQKPPVERLFTELFAIESRRRAMFVAAMTGRQAATEPVELVFSREQAYVSFTAVNRVQDERNISRWMEPAQSDFGWPDAFALGLYIPIRLVEEILGSLSGDKKVVLLEDVTDVPDFVVGGAATVAARESMFMDIDGWNFTSAKARLNGNVEMYGDPNGTKLESVIYSCGDKLAGFTPVEAGVGADTDVCLYSHRKQYGRGFFLAGGSVAREAADKENDAAALQDKDTVMRELQATHDEKDGRLPFIRSYRLSFGNRQLNLVIANQEPLSTLNTDHNADIAIAACALVSVALVSLSVALFQLSNSNKRTQLEQRRVLIADAARLANEQATKYAVHELETPLLAMTRLSSNLQQALDDATVDLRAYLASRTGIDGRTLLHVMDYADPSVVMHELLRRGMGEDISAEDRAELQALVVETADDLRCCRDDMEQVHQSCLAMARLISDLLDLASLRKGEFKLNLERVSLSRLMTALVNQHRGMAMVPLRLEPLPRALPTYIMIDPLRFAQVLSNGLTNACKLTREGSIYVAARVEWADDSETLPDAGEALCRSRAGSVGGERGSAESGAGLGSFDTRFAVIRSDNIAAEADDSMDSGPDTAAHERLSVRGRHVRRVRLPRRDGSMVSPEVTPSPSRPTPPPCAPTNPPSSGQTSVQSESRSRASASASLPFPLATWFMAYGSEVDPLPSSRSKIIITISDTGPGIEGVDTERLFQPFEQGPAQAGNGAHGEGEQRGTGLGLSLARRLARAMGGDLELRNRTTCRGSLYVATVPLFLEDDL